MSNWMYYLSRSTGIVAMLLVVAALLWGFLFSSRATGNRLRPNWWLDLHNWLGGIAMIFTIAHIATSYLDRDAGRGSLHDPGEQGISGDAVIRDDHDRGAQVADGPERVGSAHPLSQVRPVASGFSENPRQAGGKVLEDGRATFRVLLGRHQATGLVIEPEPGALALGHGLAVDKHLVRRRDVQRDGAVFVARRGLHRDDRRVGLDAELEIAIVGRPPARALGGAEGDRTLDL